MKVYGADICIDCRNLKHIIASRGLEVDYVDIMENTKNLKEFLRLRDSHPVFEECRVDGGIGIPVFIVGENYTLEIDEAMEMIGQPPIRDEEIMEWRK